MGFGVQRIFDMRCVRIPIKTKSGEASNMFFMFIIFIPKIGEDEPTLDVHFFQMRWNGVETTDQ